MLRDSIHKILASILIYILHIFRLFVQFFLRFSTWAFKFCYETTVMMAGVGNKLILDDVSVAVDQNFGIHGDGKQSKLDSEHSGSDTEEVLM